MPDLTFSEIELERNVLGKTASSETWLDGEVVSKAEATRKRLPNVQISQAEAVAAAAKARGSEGYDAGHWYFQPVGGRQVRDALRHREAVSGMLRDCRQRRMAAARQGRQQQAGSSERGGGPGRWRVRSMTLETR